MSESEDLYNASVMRSIQVGRYSKGVSQDVLKLIKLTDEDLVEKLGLKLDKVTQRGLSLSKSQRARLETVRTFTRDFIDEQTKGMQSGLSAEYKKYAKDEASFYGETMGRVTGDNFLIPSASVLNAVVTSTPFDGKLLKEWTGQWGANKKARVWQQVQIGMIEAETTADIVKRIRGTAVNKFKDGVLSTSLRGADSLVSTATAGVMNNARQELYEENKDIIKKEQFVAVLDSRTTPICQSYAGKVFPRGQGPMPPLHIRCRSIRIPVIGAPLKDISYDQWLQSQPVDIQNDVLGVRKGQLYRSGDLTVDKFVDETGYVYTLEQLKKRESLAWKKSETKGP